MDSAARRSTLLVVGLGSSESGDDAVGFEVVRWLLRHPRETVEACEGPADLTRLLDLWEGRELVVLVDAVRSGAPPGTVFRWEELHGAWSRSGVGVSSHGISLDRVVELGQALGRLPHRLVVYGVEVERLARGRGLSSTVRSAVPRVGARIAAEASRLEGPAHGARPVGTVDA